MTSSTKAASRLRVCFSCCLGRKRDKRVSSGTECTDVMQSSKRLHFNRRCRLKQFPCETIIHYVPNLNDQVSCHCLRETPRRQWSENVQHVQTVSFTGFLRLFYLHSCNTRALVSFEFNLSLCLSLSVSLPLSLSLSLSLCLCLSLSLSVCLSVFHYPRNRERKRERERERIRVIESENRGKGERACVC